ncbi:4'-phosphopantetheinyl transferase superfamily protein [Pseudoalteromonas sp. SG43-7]|uniref:4'-phosphopantetheinyl transferase family protein n=1 Tax=unclassified Pseudoalteromonas TaxID=194690 RepID=UPI00160071EF|nr:MULTISPECIES: 4'-phosphopantetheinyl transferase superfamily protein [unclassified Pseudoalteromonas]MBB1332177.1 4'-phosphopantetheinyl transferase superfamily protein [Pseudoalteromonas sp. SR41-6]MBB1421493.1 4'-phosphopantetheinyl transferase superfamily protein [Pseudoalteromonas sp. SG43-7]MBB1434027.1 4'-phosphopantetheinyl transferase superfamily protein [Pseudoalteromonas sp. SG43-6]MBB1457435.1 4'-phosphopantetheinyl transferase superfamily protein [Pseudoalteromonas sp. SG41-8]MB
MDFSLYTKLSPQLSHNSYCCEFDSSSFIDSDFLNYQIVLPQQLQKAVVKRRAEYLAGRFCAKQVLTALNIPCFDIISGPDRAPIWPKNIIGSITHTQGIAMAIACQHTDIAGIGIDIEQLMSAKQELELQKQILHPDEYPLFRRLAGQLSHPLTVIFSAKESIFKALYPSVKQFFGFEAAQLIAFNQQQLQFKITKSLAEQVPQDTYVTVFYQCNKSVVLTECEFTIAAQPLKNTNVGK